MNSKSAGGSSQKEELQSVANNPFATPSAVENVIEDEPELDELFYEVWGWFLKLHKKRTSSGFGINPIQYSEIESLFRLVQYQPHEWEVETIQLFDDVAIDYYAKEVEKENKKNKKKK